MNSSNLIGIILGIKTANGKFKPKFGKRSIIGITIMILIWISCFFTFIYGLINLNFEFIIYPILGMLGFGYLLLINPYLQNTNNYYIEFKNNDSLAEFKLFYKGKLVNIQYKIDEEGKILFSNNTKKTNCISYADQSKMTDLTKYKIINYFSKWLNDNNLLSKKVTVSLE